MLCRYLFACLWIEQVFHGELTESSSIISLPEDIAIQASHLLEYLGVFENM